MVKSPEHLTTEPPIPVLLAWSGGKDSALSLARLRQAQEYRVVGLLTAITTAYDRISMHGIRRAILLAQSSALDLPVFEAHLALNAGNAEYETAWIGAIKTAGAAVGPVNLIAYGDLFLEEIRRFREEQGHRAGYTPLFPLWGVDTRSLAREFIEAGYEAYLTCVDTTQLAPEFAGRRFDATLLQDLPPTVDPCGERGEFHTCVVAGPGFRSRIAVELGERVRREERFEYCDLIPIANSSSSAAA